MRVEGNLEHEVRKKSNQNDKFTYSSPIELFKIHLTNEDKNYNIF